MGFDKRGVFRGECQNCRSCKDFDRDPESLRCGVCGCLPVVHKATHSGQQKLLHLMDLKNRCDICGKENDGSIGNPIPEVPECPELGVRVDRVLFKKKVTEILHELKKDLLHDSPADTICKQCNIVLMRICVNSCFVQETKDHLGYIIKNSQTGCLDVSDKPLLPVACFICRANFNDDVRQGNCSFRNRFRLREKLQERGLSGSQVLEKLDISVPAELRMFGIICKKCHNLLGSVDERLCAIEKSMADLKSSYSNHPRAKQPSTSQIHVQVKPVSKSPGEVRFFVVRQPLLLLDSHSHRRPPVEEQAGSSVSTESVPLTVTDSTRNISPTVTNATANVPPTVTNATANVPPTVTNATANVPPLVTNDVPQDVNDVPIDPKKSKPQRPSIATAHAHICAGRYRSGLRSYMRSSQEFNQVFQELVAEMACEEMVKMCGRSTKSLWRTSPQEWQKPYTDFGWEKAVSEAKRDCPILFAAISGAVTSQRDQLLNSKTMTKERKAVATAFAVMAHSRYPKKMNLLQQLVGVQLWLSNSSPEVFKCLKSLGMSLSKSEAARFVNNVCESANEVFCRKKQDVESSWKRAGNTSKTTRARKRRPIGFHVHPHRKAKKKPYFLTEDVIKTSVYAAVDETATEDVEMTDTAPQSSADENTEQNTSMQAVSDTGTDERQQNVPYCGYSIMFGKAKLVKTTAITSHNKKDIRNMFQAHTIIDRVPSLHLNDNRPTPADVQKIDPAVCLPTATDYESLRKSYVVVVQRILTRLMPCFKQFADTVPEHLPHRFSEESSRKSEMIPLGVEHTSKNKTMGDIFHCYQEAAPGLPGVTDPITTILYGDRIEKLREAQKACSDGLTKWDRLEGLHPALQEHHKQAQLMQDTFMMLHDANSVESVGTLAHIKDKYKHLFHKDRFELVSNSTASLLRFCTEAYVLAAACAFLSLHDPSATPSSTPSPGVLANVTDAIVDVAFKPPIVATSDEEAHCICKSTKEDDTMVYCENKECDRGSWFHLSCLNLSPEDLPQEFYCSKKCAEACSKRTNPPHCQDSMDHVFEYSKALLSRGLDEMVRHDAISENDGNRMLTHWKFDTLDFLGKNHSRLFTEGLNLLIDVNGGTSRRVAHQLQWNRTVNPTGGPGCNIAMDSYLDKLNQQYKEVFQTWSGKPKDFRARHFSPGMLPLLMGVQRISDTAPLDTCDSTTESQQGNKTSNILDLAKLLVENQCLQKTSRRCHKGFTDFIFQRTSLNKEEVLARVTSLKKKALKKKK